MQAQNSESNWKRYWPWLIWVVAAFAVPYQFLLQTSTSVMVPDLMKAFSIDATGIGFLSSIFFYTYLIFQVPAGICVDWYGARKLLAIGVGFCAAGAFCFAYAKTLWMADVGRLLMGIGAAPSVPGAMYIAAHWFKPKRFAMLAGFTETLGLLGGAFGEIQLAHLLSDYGWRKVIYFSAAVGVILVVLIWVVVRDAKKSKHTEVHCHCLTDVVKEFLGVLKKPQVWWLGAYSGLMFALLPAFAGLWAVPCLESCLHINLQLAALGSSLIFIGAGVSCPLWGWLSDQLGRRRLPMIIGAVMTLIFMTTFIAMSHLHIWSAFCLLFCIGFSCGVYVLPFAAVKDITPSHTRGSALSFTNLLCIVLGAPILQPIIGYSLKHSWAGAVINGLPLYTGRNFQMALVSLPICIFLALLIACFVLKDPKLHS